MLYLIQVDYIDGSLLKIGYTLDDNKDRRFSQYLLHNPKSRVIAEIPGGKEIHEKELINRFHEYKYSGYGNEWFNYSNDIIDFFNTHKTLESLEKSLVGINTFKNKLEKFNYFKSEVYKIIDYVLSERLNDNSITPQDAIKQKDNLVNNIINNRGLRSISSIWNYVRVVFNIYPPEFKDLSEEVKLDVNDFLYSFSQFKQYTQKMKFLCDSCLSKESLDIILKQIPVEFSTYFMAFSVEKIKALNYQKSKLKNEYSKICSNDNKILLKNEILEKYKIGNTYLLSEIKVELSRIFNKLNIRLSPKATILNNYFHLKSVKITNKDTGKRDRCFKIIKIKE